MVIEPANRGRLYFLVCVSTGSREFIHLLLIRVIMILHVNVIHIMSLSSRMWQHVLTHPVPLLQITDHLKPRCFSHFIHIFGNLPVDRQKTKSGRFFF